MQSNASFFREGLIDVSFCSTCAYQTLPIVMQSNLDYPDLDYLNFSIIRIFSLVPIGDE